jgi:hypothetical protein
VAEYPEQHGTILVRQAIQAAIDAAREAGLDDVVRDLSAILMDLAAEQQGGSQH